MTVIIILATDGNLNSLIRKIKEIEKMDLPSRILIVLGKKGVEMIETIDSMYFRLTFIYVVQPVSKGSGHAIMCCLPYLKQDDQVLILFGNACAEAMSRMICNKEYRYCVRVNKTTDREMRIYSLFGIILMEQSPFLTIGKDGKYDFSDILNLVPVEEIEISMVSDVSDVSWCDRNAVDESPF